MYVTEFEELKKKQLEKTEKELTIEQVVFLKENYKSLKSIQKMFIALWWFIGIGVALWLVYFFVTLNS